MDQQKIHLEEHKRMKENKETEFVFLLEEERPTEAPRAEEQPEAGARRLEDIETCESIDTTLKVRHLTASIVTRILRMDKGVTHFSVGSSDAGECRKAFFQTETMEASLRCHLSLRRAHVDVLSRRTQGAGFPPRDDCVVVVLPLWNDVRMTGDGRAVLQHHPDNQVIIEYPQRLNRLAMGENRAEVLQGIGAVSNAKSMEATE